MTALAIALAGGLGAVARFETDAFIRSRVRLELPVATILINVVGSFLLGVLVGVTVAGAHGDDAAQVYDIAGVGVLGGFTTFSTANVETVRLLQEGGTRAAVINVLGTLIGALAAAGLGLWMTGAL